MVSRGLNSMPRGLYVFFGNRPPSNLVKEDIALARGGFDLNFNVSKLTATAGLLFVNLFTRRCLSNCFAISNLWLPNICFNTQLTLHPIHNDLPIQLTHSGNNHLPGLLICRD